MKRSLLAALIVVFSCTEKHFEDCNTPIADTSVGFMLHGGILDKYDEGRVYIGITKVNNPYDWDFNEYFTGTGFSKDKTSEKLVLEKDSCELKHLYFEFLKNAN